eukprot:Clim_evm23s11 gene=Clim_evmTU23s11
MVVGTQAPVYSINDFEVLGGSDAGMPGQLPAPGEVTVLESWATWCPPCRQSIPHLTQMQAKYRAQNVRVIGITGEDFNVCEPFVKKMGKQMDYLVLQDESGRFQDLQAQAGVQGIPHAFVIDRQGKITWSGHPMDPNFENAIQTACATPKKVDPETRSKEELTALSVKELKNILADHNVSAAGCLEKADLVARIDEKCRL